MSGNESTITHGASESAPLRFGGGEDRTKSRSSDQRGEHTNDLPRFGPHGCVKPYSCFECIMSVLEPGAQERYEQYTAATYETGPSPECPPPSPLLPLGLLLYARRGFQQWQHSEEK